MWVSNDSCCTCVVPQPPPGNGEMAVWPSLYRPVCSCPKKVFLMQIFKLGFTCCFGQQEDLPHWVLRLSSLTGVSFECNTGQRPRSSKAFLEMYIQTQPHTLTKTPYVLLLMLPGGSTWQELICSSHEEPGHELPLKCHKHGHTDLPLAYQTSQAAALVRAEVLYLYHTRGSSHAAWLLKAEAAFYYSGQSSVSSLWGIRLQDQMLASVRRYSYRRAREFCWCRDRFAPRFSWGELHSMLWKSWATGILVGVNYICQI